MKSRILKNIVCRIKLSRIPAPAVMLALLLLPLNASAHVLQYLSWFTIERNMELYPDQLRMTYNCHFNPAVFDPKNPLMDTDGDSTASQHEIGDFCMQADQYLKQDLLFLIDGQPLTAREESFYLVDDNSGFQCVFNVGLPSLSAGPHQLECIDPAFLSIPGFAADTRTTTGLVLSQAQELKFVDTAHANAKSNRLELGTDFRTVLIFERAKGTTSGGDAAKTRDAATTATSHLPAGAS